MREMKMVAASVSLSHPESVPKTLPSPGSESILASLLRFLLENDISETNQGWDRTWMFHCIMIWRRSASCKSHLIPCSFFCFLFCSSHVLTNNLMWLDNIVNELLQLIGRQGTMSTESEALISVEPQITPRLALLPWEASQLTSSICLYICVCASASLCRLLLA